MADLPVLRSIRRVGAVLDLSGGPLLTAGGRVLTRLEASRVAKPVKGAEFCWALRHFSRPVQQHIQPPIPKRGFSSAQPFKFRSSRLKAATYKARVPALPKAVQRLSGGVAS